MAKLEDVISANEAAFTGNNPTEAFNGLSAKLAELGYDVLINDRKNTEFVPAGRLNEVVSQRDGLKGQLEQANASLEAMKRAANGNEELQSKLQGMINSNNELIKENEQMKLQSAVILAAKDAINAQDLLAFINMDSVKINKQGQIIGIDSEITRLKTEKPYLFNSANNNSGRGGMEPGGGSSVPTGGMNGMIRRAAGRV